jgi:hypothetical protein
MKILTRKALFYRWIIVAAVIGIFCGVQSARAENDDIFDYNTPRYTIEPNNANYSLDLGDKDLDAYDVIVDNNLVTQYISGTLPERLGGELVTNGDFSDGPNDWNVGDHWSISGGDADFSCDVGDADGALQQDIGVVSGKKYRVEFEITAWSEDWDVTDGDMSVHFGTWPTWQTIDNLTLSADGTGSYSYDVTATKSGPIAFSGYAGSDTGDGTDITIDDVSVVEIVSDDSVRDVYLDPNLFIEVDLDAGGDANVAGNLTVGGTLGVTGVATLGDSSQLATSAAPTADADIANKKYVDDQIPASQGVIKGWVNFDGTGTVTIRDSYNVSSVTDNGSGDYTINWDTDFTDPNYCVMITTGDGWTMNNHSIVGVINTMAAGSVRIKVHGGGTFVDDDYICVLAIGDQ